MEKDDGIDVVIQYDDGDMDCNHEWKESKLLFVKVCQKCRAVQPLG